MEWNQIVRVVLIGLGLLALLALYIFLLVRLFRLLQVKADRLHRVKLSNQGNVISKYQLSVESPESQLSFNLSYKDIPLVEVPVVDINEQTIEEIEVIEPDVPSQVSGTKQTALKKPSVDASTAIESGKKVATKIGTVASFLGVLGNLIPGSLGNKLKDQGAKARKMQTDTLKTVQAPEQAKRKIDAVKREGGKVGGGKGKILSAGSASTVRIDSQAGSGGEVRQQPSFRKRSSIPSLRKGYLVQTKEIAPGESLILTLKVGSKVKRYPQGSFLYKLESQQIPPGGVNLTIPPVETTGTVNFKPIPNWRYWLPMMVSGLVLIVTVLSIIVYLT